MANPTRLEAQYERIERWWIKLPLVRSSVRLQQFPFIVVMLMLYGGSLLLILGLADALGADPANSATTGLLLIAWVMFFFISMMLLVIRGSQRAARGDSK